MFGTQVDGEQRLTTLYRQLVERSTDVVVTLDDQGRITFVNDASRHQLGYEPGELIGTNALDLVHPDDLDRAAADLASQPVHGPPRGTASFRLRHARGHWAALDITASDASDGERQLIALTGRLAEDRRATDEVVLRLLHGGSRRELFRPVCDLFAWQLNGSQVGISWWEPREGWAYVSTGLPAEMVGAADEAASPWAECRAGFTEASGLDHPVGREAGFTSHWIVPVPDAGGRPPALITVWGGFTGEPQQVHAYGMSVARTFVELILRWTHQVQRLDAAAHADQLTGLANRKAFFDALDEVEDHGAVLYCDLDRFKPVNDAYGHTCGDEVLRQAAGRLLTSARVGDVVARLGGDEFAVMCPGVTGVEAHAVAARITEAFVAPFVVGLREIDVGISIGVGCAPDRLSTDTLEAADHDLFLNKPHHQRSVRHTTR